VEGAWASFLLFNPLWPENFDLQNNFCRWAQVSSGK
jgi:hypothetical protein